MGLTGALAGTGASNATFSVSGISNRNLIAIQGVAGQTADLFVVQNNTPTTLFDITAAGNVGIGTTGPAALLHALISNSANPVALFERTTSSTGSLGINFGSGISSFASVNAIRFSTGSTAGTGGTEQLRIDTTGNVGIGTTAPQAKLHIDQGNVIIGAASGGTQDLIFREDTTNLMGFRYQGGQSGNPLDIYNFQTAATLVRIKEDGNVGIGTTAPTYRLSTLNSVSTAGSAVSAITNTNTTDSANTVTLRLNTGVTSTTTNARFVTFYAGCTTENCAGTAVGNISINNGNVAYNTGEGRLCRKNVGW